MDPSRAAKRPARVPARQPRLFFGPAARDSGDLPSQAISEVPVDTSILHNPN